MMLTPFNNIIVKVQTRYIRNISNILKMSAIQQGASVDPVDVVNIIGEIVGLPKSIGSSREYEGYSLQDIKVGDKAIFSHSVIFSFSENGTNDEPVHKNMFFYKGEEYFICDIQKLFAVIRDGEIIMVNGFVMIYDFPESKIILSTKEKKKTITESSEVMHIGRPKTNQPNFTTIFSGDAVYFNPQKTIKYQIGGKPFRIISQSHILGKQVV